MSKVILCDHDILLSFDPLMAPAPTSNERSRIAHPRLSPLNYRREIPPLINNRISSVAGGDCLPNLLTELEDEATALQNDFPPGVVKSKNSSFKNNKDENIPNLVNRLLNNLPTSIDDYGSHECCSFPVEERSVRTKTPQNLESETETVDVPIVKRRLPNNISRSYIDIAIGRGRMFPWIDSGTATRTNDPGTMANGTDSGTTPNGNNACSTTNRTVSEPEGRSMPNYDDENLTNELSTTRSEIFKQQSFFNDLNHLTAESIVTVEEIAAGVNSSSPQISCCYIDTHCHLDILFSKLQFCDDYTAFKQRFSSTWSPFYAGCISDFCFPSSFMNDRHFFDSLFLNDDVRVAVGCHPHAANLYTPEVEEYLITKMSHRKVIAFGEFGLDNSKNNNVSREVQELALRRQIKIATRMFETKPLVIHCRDAEDRCLEIMKTVVPHTYPIHLHCFMGSFEQAMKWSEYFTNLYFGITTSICAPRNQQVDFITRVPLNRLLIETDTPYFLPEQYRGMLQYNHPGLGELVGYKIAEFRDIDAPIVFETIYENTLSLYKTFYD